jgi:hypothetical protein
MFSIIASWAFNILVKSLRRACSPKASSGSTDLPIQEPFMPAVHFDPNIDDKLSNLAYDTGRRLGEPYENRHHFSF